MSKLSVELDRLDHFALTVRDVDATCVFYEKVLGMSRERFDEDRIALRFGGQRININPNPNDRLRKAAVPVPGSAEFCLVSGLPLEARSEEHTSELQSLMRIPYAVFCLK